MTLFKTLLVVIFSIGPVAPALPDDGEPAAFAEKAEKPKAEKPVKIEKVLVRR